MASPLNSVTHLVFLLLSTIFSLLLLMTPSTATTEFVLYSSPPQALLPGQSLTYDMTPHNIPYGPFNLTMQKDCNLVTYVHGKLDWTSNTSGMGDNCFLSVDSYGEVSVKRNTFYPVWRSNVTSVEGKYAFVLQWTGSLGVYGPAIWSNSDHVELSNDVLDNDTTDYIYSAYTVLPAGLILKYKNFRLVLEEECNLVLFNTDTGAIKWQTNTTSPYRDCFATLDDKGELFVKHRRREILWRSGIRGVSNMYVLSLQFDGRLVIYGPQIWTTKPFW